MKNKLKVIFAMNGDGKSKKASEKRMQGKRVLTSRMRNWRKKSFDTRNVIKKIKISEFSNDIRISEAELDNLIKMVSDKKFLNYKGKKSILSNFIKENKIDEDMKTHIFWNAKLSKTNNKIAISDVLKVFDKYNKYKFEIEKLSNNEYEEILLFLEIKEKLKKNIKKIEKPKKSCCSL